MKMSRTKTFSQARAYGGLSVPFCAFDYLMWRNRRCKAKSGNGKPWMRANTQPELFLRVTRSDKLFA
jgi:hypothetical protein